MQFYLFFVLTIISLGCTPQFAQFRPNHVGLSPSIEWEVQKGEPAICKQKVEMNLNWDL